MLEYLSKARGMGGTLKEQPEDFIVEEIMKDGTVLEIGKTISHPSKKGDFTHFVMQKTNWNTIQAIHEVGRLLGTGPRRFGYAGTKDRIAVTVQLCSAWQVEPARLLSIRPKDISINGAWLAKDAVELGDLAGNQFCITVRGVKKSAAKQVKEISEELGGVFPNYFGEQRFGSVRSNTHLVGKAMVKGDFKSAVMCYLCLVGDEELPEAKEARQRLPNELDFAAALKYFPRYLKYERSMIAYLAERKNDYAGAIRNLPRSLSLMFVHAYQSHLFNTLLSRRVEKHGSKKLKGDTFCGKNAYGFPDVEAKGKSFITGRVIGYETRKLTEGEKRLLKEEGVAQGDFRVKSLPELGSKGTERALFAPVKDFWFEARDENGIFTFSLPPGSYATVLLREFIDVKK